MHVDSDFAIVHVIYFYFYFFFLPARCACGNSILENRDSFNVWEVPTENLQLKYWSNNVVGSCFDGAVV